MVDVHEEPQKRVKQALLAALLVRPLDPALAEDELETILIMSGFSQGVAREVLSSMFRNRRRNLEKIKIEATDIWAYFRHFEFDYPQGLFPLVAVRDLQTAYDELDAIQGKTTAKTLAMLEVRCPRQEPKSVIAAVGFMKALGAVKQQGDGYVRLTSFLDEIEPNGYSTDHPWVPFIQELKVIVGRVFAMRTGELLPTSTPVERFGRFLTKQGWHELADWWTQTSHEMNVLSPLQPIAITVLAGALLEAALVAIAAPAKNAREWRETWINDSPTDWKLGKLVSQAEKAGTFSVGDMALAKGIAEFRNRIHVGRHSATWQGPFVPPHTNEHEGRMAKDHLNRLLDSILKWPPIAALSP